MYVCDDPVCDPVCDFCWFCEHDENGVSKYCSKAKMKIFAMASATAMSINAVCLNHNHDMYHKVFYCKRQIRYI